MGLGLSQIRGGQKKTPCNCSENSLSASGYKGILYLESLGGDQLNEALCSFSVLRKTESQAWSPRTFGLCFFQTISPPCLGLFLSEKGRRQKAACTMSAPTKFHLSVGDGAT